MAASFRKTIVGEKHCYHIAKQWKADQDAAESNCREYAPHRYIPVTYENLIRDPENTLRILLHHMGLGFEAPMLQYHQTKEAEKTAEAGKMWDNVRKPVMVNNSNKFLSQLSEEDVLIFESVAGETLQRHGYTPYFSHNKWIEKFSESDVSLFAIANAQMKAEALNNFDPDGVKKREAQDHLVKEIIQRLQ